MGLSSRVRFVINIVFVTLLSLHFSLIYFFSVPNNYVSNLLLFWAERLSFRKFLDVGYSVVPSTKFSSDLDTHFDLAFLASMHMYGFFVL